MSHGSNGNCDIQELMMVSSTGRVVNLAQSTRFGPDQCGLWPKNRTRRKSPQLKKPTWPKSSQKRCGSGSAHGFPF